MIIILFFSKKAICSPGIIFLYSEASVFLSYLCNAKRKEDFNLLCDRIEQKVKGITVLFLVVFYKVCFFTYTYPKLI